MAISSVADNIALGRETGFFLRRAVARQAARDGLARLGTSLDPELPVRRLSVAQQQMVEIARALAGHARVLVLDEPTASLPSGDVERLFAALRTLRDEGLGIVYISHRLDEVFALADRVTVLRDGRVVTTAAATALTRAELIRLMVGRAITEEFPARSGTAGPLVLEARGLSAPPRIHAASLDVRAGEIVGLAGLVGAGRTSTALALAGGLAARGTLVLRGRPVRFSSPHDALRQGVAYVTEDRKGRGLIPHMSAAGNLTLSALSRFARGGWLRPSVERAAAAAAAARFDVRAASLDTQVTHLSGGNQQKVLLARASMTAPAVLVLDEPTRGVDVGARAEIYALMNRLTAEGLAIVMVSSDLPEVLGMSDRLYVMRDGRTRGQLARGEATAERVMALATAA